MGFFSKKPAQVEAPGLAASMEVIQPYQPRALSEPAPAAVAASDAAQGDATQDNRFAISLAQMVMMLMRSPQYKNLSLADLEWFVLPALQTNQCAVLENTDVPAERGAKAVAMWATVSPEVDARLQADTGAVLQLGANEWRSGEIVWLIDALGDSQSVQQLIGYLRTATFKGRDLKLRSWDPNGFWSTQVLQAA
jgi:hemolysin-activating ACP:hemolysin acyltransferase